MTIQTQWKYSSGNLDFRVTDEDILNPEDYPVDVPGLVHTHRKKLYVWIDHGFTIVAVIADSWVESFDLLANGTLLDSFMIPMEEASKAGYPRFSNGKTFDLEGIDCHAIPLPGLSVCTLLAAENPRNITTSRRGTIR